MNEIKTQTWLKNLKISLTHINEQQLKNGYLFGLIFERLNLSNGKKFKNSHDLPCIFQNYKNTKDLLLDNFGIDFPANEIIYKGDQLLQRIRDSCMQYQQNKKQTTLNQIKRKYMPKNTNSILPQTKLLSNRQKQIKLEKSIGNQTLNSTFNQVKLPKKILQIQKKLQKYKQQKTRHELLSLQTRKYQLQQLNHVVQQHRLFQMSKTRMNHQQTKQLQRRTLQVVTKTNQQKQKRIERQQQFFRFMKSKKDKFDNDNKLHEQLTFKQGLEDFQLNCIRQGVQLEHDPNKQYQPKNQHFNQVVMLQRIKDNIKNLQRQRKQRKKRQNSKALQAQQANLKSQKIWQQINMLDELQKNITRQYKFCQNISSQILYQKASIEQVNLKQSKKAIKAPLPQATAQEIQQFESNIRANRLVYYDREIQRLQKRDKQMKNIAQQVLQALLYTTIAAEEAQHQLAFSFTQWKHYQQLFVQFVDQTKKISKVGAKKIQIDPQSKLTFTRFLKEVNEKKTLKNSQNQSQIQLANFIDQMIENTYPKLEFTQKQSLPLYMPIRIGIAGTKLSGKTTQIKKIMSKYSNLVLIDPKKILGQALQLAKSVPVNEDPKKKKDAKKVQQQTPQRIQLKKFGESILQQIKVQRSSSQQAIDIQSLPIQYLIKAIRYKLLQCFSFKSQKQIFQLYNKRKSQQQQRIKDFALNAQDKNKKKDPKKAVQAVEVEAPVFNQYFYVEGFIIDNLDLNQPNLRIVQKELNNFVPFEQRLNQQAEHFRQQYSAMMPIKQSKIPKTLNKGFFNLLIDLESSNQSLAERNQNRKVDPQTGQVYHPKFNPVPTDVKGLAERLLEQKPFQLESQQMKRQNQINRQKLYNSFGYEENKLSAYKKLQTKEVQQTTAQITKLMEQMLQVEYEKIKQFKEVNEQQQQTNQRVKENQAYENAVQVAIQVFNKQQQERQQILTLQNLLSQCPSTSSLLSSFTNILESYQSITIFSLSKLSSSRSSFQQHLLQQQKKFIQIINRPDDKAGKILTFQDNYNKLLEEKANILNDNQAVQHLVDKLDQLYDHLWIAIEHKKNQAIKHRQQFILSDWIDTQTRALVQNAKNLLQNQLNLLVDILGFILNVQLTLNNSSAQPVIDYLCLGIPKTSQPICSINIPIKQQGISPRLEYYFNQTQSCLDTIEQWFRKKQAQSKLTLTQELNNLASRIINKQKMHISSVVKHIHQELFSLISEEVCYYKALVNKMDDWIIIGIKEQNQFTYNIYKQVKSKINSIKKSNLKSLFFREITSSLHPIQGISLFAQKIPTTSQYFSFPSYKILLIELKCLVESKNEIQKISFQRLKQYFNKRIKSNLLDQVQLGVDFDVVQQYLVTDGDLNVRELLVALLINQYQVLHDQALNQYQQSFNTKNQQTFNTNNQQAFSTIDQSYSSNKLQSHQTYQNTKALISHPDELIVAPLLGQKYNFLGKSQIKGLQSCIFEIMRDQYTNKVSIKQLIQVLRMFNSLQLQTYGDSLRLSKKK